MADYQPHPASRTSYGNQNSIIKLFINDIRKFINSPVFNSLTPYHQDYWLYIISERGINSLNQMSSLVYVIEQAIKQNISLSKKVRDYLNNSPLPNAKNMNGEGKKRIYGGAGLFDLISPIANMFSGNSFNTPLDSIIPRELSTKIASAIADEGLGGSKPRRRRTKKGKGILSDLAFGLGSTIVNSVKDTIAKAPSKLLDTIDKKLSGNGAKKPNPWIAHVKKVAKDKKITYREALKIASKSYKK